MIPRSVFSKAVIGDPGNEDKAEDLESINSQEDSSESVVADGKEWDEESLSPSRKIIDKSYLYTAASMLNYDGIGTIPEDFNDIILIMFKINTDGKIPFLEFGMNYDIMTGECDFMRISKEQLPELTSSFKTNIGYMLNNKKAYIFVELDNSQRDANQMMSFVIPTLEFVVTDEIVNLQHVYGDPISEEVTEFFSEYRHFLFLYDINYNMYETPSIGYAGIEKSNADFVKVFGIDRSESTAPFGSGFYFTSFTNAYQNAVNPKYEYISPSLLNKTGKMKNGVVSRFILFLGQMKVVNNHPDNDIDESDIKTCMINKSETRKNAKLTMRITDHDGKWQQNFDSVFIGDLLLDDGTKLDTGPLYVIKEHNQQMCINYRSANLLNTEQSS